MKKNSPSPAIKPDYAPVASVQKPLSGIWPLGVEPGGGIGPVATQDFAHNSARFEDFNPEAPDYPSLLLKLKSYSRSLVGIKDMERLLALIEKINRIHYLFLDRYHVLSTLSLQIGPDRDRYLEDYQKVKLYLPEVEEQTARTFERLLDSPLLEELSLVTGKNFFLKVNASYMAKSLGLKKERAEASKLEDKFFAERAKLAPLKLDKLVVRQTDILFDQLVKTRLKISQGLELSSFNDWVFLENAYVDTTPEALRTLRDQLKRYFLPLHIYKMESLGLGQDQDKGQFYKEPTTQEYMRSYETIEDNVIHYYETYYGDEDWELRHLEEIFPEDMKKGRKSVYPSSPTFVFTEGPKAFFEKASLAVDNSLDRSDKGFLFDLGQKGFIRLDAYPLAFSHPLSVDYLAGPDRPLLTGTYKETSAFTVDFIQKTGELYAYLKNPATTSLKSVAYSLGIPYGHRRMWGLGMEALTLKKMDLFFPDDGLLYLKDRMNRMIRKILCACMIDEFEEAIYQNPAMQMLERINCWQELRKTYHMEYFTESLFWMDNKASRALVDYPCRSLTRVLPDFMALYLIGLSHKDQEEAYQLYDDFCSLALDETFLRTLARAHFPDPFAVGTAKEIAYRMAEILEPA